MLPPKGLQAPQQTAPTAQARQLVAAVQHARCGVEALVRRDAGHTQRLRQHREGTALALGAHCDEQRIVDGTAGVGRVHQGVVEAAGQAHGVWRFLLPLQHNAELVDLMPTAVMVGPIACRGPGARPLERWNRGLVCGKRANRANR
jgi:hypothetical protein